MPESQTFILEKGQSPMDAMQQRLDDLEIEANAVDLTLGEYSELIKERLQN